MCEQKFWKSFKRCLEMEASRHPFKYNEFIRYRDVNVFFYDESSNPSPPKVLAANALSQLCIGDGDSMDRCVCGAVVQFLTQNCGCSAEKGAGLQQLIDIIQIIKDLKTFEQKDRFKQCFKWANSWYT
jgi:hypothetical protein